MFLPRASVTYPGQGGELACRLLVERDVESGGKTRTRVVMLQT